MYADALPNNGDCDARGLWPYTDARLLPILACGRNDSVATLGRSRTCPRTVTQTVFLCDQAFGYGQRASAMPSPPCDLLRQSMRDGHSGVDVTARKASHQSSCLCCVGTSVRASTQCHAGMPPFLHHGAPPVTLGSYANTPMAKRFAWHRKVPRRVRVLRLWFFHCPRLAPQTAILRIQYAWCSWKRNSKGPEDTFHQWKHISTRHLDLLGAPNCQVWPGFTM